MNKIISAFNINICHSINDWIFGTFSDSNYIRGNFTFVCLTLILFIISVTGSSASVIAPDSTHFSSSLSHEQTERFADYTIKEALSRMTGIQVGRRGDINIRGVGYNRYNVLIDGQRVGMTGMGDRSIDLGNFSTDMVREIKIIKVLTPDMDADALAGSVHLITDRYVFGDREMDLRIGGGSSTRYFPYNGLGSRSLFRYSEALREDISIDVNLNHRLNQRGWESLQLGYNVADLGDGPVDVVELIAPGLHTDNSNIFGGKIQFTFQPNEQDRYHVWGMMNNNSRTINRHRNSWIANESWIEFSNSELRGDDGSYRYDLRYKDIQVRQYILQAGGSHHLNLLNISYSLGWSQSNFLQENYLFPFMLNGFEYSIDMANRNRPAMQITNVPLQPDGSVHKDLLSLQNMDRIIDDHSDDSYTGRVDITIPYNMGSFSIGSSVRVTSRRGDFSDMNFRDRPTTLNRFSTIRGEDFDVLNQDHYFLPNLIDPEKTTVFFNNRFPRLRLDEQLHFENSEIWNYSALESILAGYGMTTIEIGKFELLGGARLEYDDMKYTGRLVEFNSAGRFTSSADNTRKNDKLHVFPNVQLGFSPSSLSNVRLAWSKSIARPDFYHLAPFQLVSRQDTTIFRGNPELDYMVSDNLDLYADHYFNRAGTVSMGLFYKQLNGFVFERQQTIQITEGEFAGFDNFFRNDETLTSLPVQERMYQNSDESATIYGAEVSWQHDLDFLPGFLGNLGTYANYTWSQSVYDVPYRDDEVSLPGHSPHVVNLALDYNQGRLSSSISYHWTAVMLAWNGLQTERSVAPAFGSSELRFMDRYEEGWSDISASIKYRLTNNFFVWTDIINLLGGTEYVQYDHSRELYPVEIDYRGGRFLMMGIHYSL